MQVKATEQCFPLVLFITLYNYMVVLTFESAYEIFKMANQLKAAE